MKKIMLAAVFLIATLCIPRHAWAVGGTGFAEIGFSTGTTPVLIKATAGTLFNIVASSEQAAGFTVCYDSASALGYTAATDSDGTATAPQIAELFAQAASNTFGLPIHVWQQSMNFTNGLVCIRKNVGHAKIYFL
jgi:hypothetical protein